MDRRHRLKNPPGKAQTDYFDELLERIRDIRSSEHRFYQKILDIWITPNRTMEIRSIQTTIRVYRFVHAETRRRGESRGKEFLIHVTNSAFSAPPREKFRTSNMPVTDANVEFIEHTNGLVTEEVKRIVIFRQVTRVPFHAIHMPDTSDSYSSKL